MKFAVRLLLLLSFIVSNQTPAYVVVHTNFADILNYLSDDDIPEETLILFDVDNTLAHGIIALGGDEWVSHSIEQLVKQGLTYRQAFDHIAPLYFELQHALDLIATEEETARIVALLQERNYKTAGLTLRSIPIVDRTCVQLEKIGIDFRKNPIYAHEIYGQPPLLYCYKHGIIFCNGNDKGAVLQEILKHLRCKPRKIIFIDDKEKYLHQVKKVLPEDIIFYGIHYIRHANKMATFDPVATQKLLDEYLQKKSQTP